MPELPIIHPNHSHYSRLVMPQITDEQHDAFLRHLRHQGIGHRTTHMSPNSLKPTQNEINLSKVLRMLETGFDPERTILVAMDHGILDGHHRWYCAWIERVPEKVCILGAGIPRLVHEAQAFSRYEDIQTVT